MSDQVAADHRVRVVLVAGRDDEAEAVARLLAADGIEVDLTTDPAAALEHLSGSGADAVIVATDVAGGAVDVIRRLRAGGSGASAAPVIVTGGRTAIPDRLRIWEAGTDTILTKPFHIDELRGAVRALSNLDVEERERRRVEALQADRVAASGATQAG